MAHSTPDELGVSLQTLGLEQKLESYPNCYPELNPTDVYRAHITSILADITGADKSIIYPNLQWTMTLDKGDLILPVAALRIKGKKPQDLAVEWAEKFPETALLQKPKPDGPFLAFFFKVDKLAQILVPTILTRGKDFGCNANLGLKDVSDASKGKKKIVVEFSSPNIAKPFHAGHLRSTIIGGFLSNLYAGAGWDVVRINYLGDWGKQYGLLALGYEKYGDESALVADPINHLYELYVNINKDLTEEKEKITVLEATEGKSEEQQAADKAEAQKLKDDGLDEQARRYFKAMVDHDEKAIAQWKKFRDLSILRYKKTYARLNIEFDDYSGESQVSEDLIAATGKKMEEMGICEESAGAMIVDFTKHVPGKAGKSLEKPLVRKKDGTALYLTRDISEMLQRVEKHHFDQMIYVVASQQDLHLKQLFKIIELMGNDELAKKCQHINFGLVLGMSTRKGTVKFLDDILRDVGEKMHDVMRGNAAKYEQIEDPAAVADILGITSVMVQDMSGKRLNNYNFDMDAMTSFEGDTGPYLQYAHARLSSIARKANLTAEDVANADLTVLTEPQAEKLIRVISQYPDVMTQTLKTLEPTTILTYLFKLTHVLSSSYDHLRIIGSEPELQKARMALYFAAKTVINNGMRILGLSPVERM